MWGPRVRLTWEWGVCRRDQRRQAAEAGSSKGGGPCKRRKDPRRGDSRVTRRQPLAGSPGRPGADRGTDPADPDADVAVVSGAPGWGGGGDTKGARTGGLWPRDAAHVKTRPPVQPGARGDGFQGVAAGRARHSRRPRPRGLWGRNREEPPPHTSPSPAPLLSRRPQAQTQRAVHLSDDEPRKPGRQKRGVGGQGL